MSLKSKLDSSTEVRIGALAIGPNNLNFLHVADAGFKRGVNAAVSDKMELPIDTSIQPKTFPEFIAYTAMIGIGKTTGILTRPFVPNIKNSK